MLTILIHTCFTWNQAIYIQKKINTFYACILKTFIPQAPVAISHGTFGGGFGTSDIQQLGYFGIGKCTKWKQYQYNSGTQQGTSLEVIQWYKGWLNREEVYTSNKMALFNNELTKGIGGVKQNQCFVLLPLNANATTLLIYTDDTLFQNLTKYNSNGMDCTVLLIQAPKLKGWDAYLWYTYYNSMVQACANNQCWLLSYLMVVDCVEMDGFKVGESANDMNCDLSLCFQNQVLTWDTVLFSIIS